MSFAVGSLVRARKREWVVLPGSEQDFVLVRPLGGRDDESTGICTTLEDVQPAEFALPDPEQLGDANSSRILRDAVRIGFRSSAGPFRSLAHLAVEPRPYQIVPLLMALKLNPVRLLIADDVGIGKTVEAALIAREMLDRGEVRRLAVLCPPHLAEQWQAELQNKFNIGAELLLPSTAARLERQAPLRVGESIIEYYPHLVVSLDFIKSDRRRDEFLRTAPELVIVDEAHTCAFSGDGRGARHQRHRLVKEMAQKAGQHLILVTATPHSGNEEAFRSLISLLSDDLSNLPQDLSGPANERHRRRLATQFVQRRRGDIQHFLSENTPFPKREEREESYQLSPEYQQFLATVLQYSQEKVQDKSGTRFHQRVRWWSVLALLRSVASSPAAAAATLRSRASTADVETEDEADELGRRSVLDLMDQESAEAVDIVPGSDFEPEDSASATNRHRLLEMADTADKLTGRADQKLQKSKDIVAGLVNDGFNPIVFCRFIPTAEYVAEALRAHLGKDVAVMAVTGTLPPEEREARVLQLSESPRRVLVATDCLSEGINLQEHFDAVLHYDLSWNPTRHEQREGRVDRYGQPHPTVRVLTYYGMDNQIDGIVLDVLIRKHKTIRSSLGISVPVPVDSSQVMEAVFEGLLLREIAGANNSLQLSLAALDRSFAPQKQELYGRWEEAADREKRSRTMFAQETLAASVEEARQELQAVRTAIGTHADVQQFALDTLHRLGAVITNGKSANTWDINIAEVPIALRDAFGLPTKFRARFELPVQKGEVYLQRTHPAVEALCSYVLECALDGRNNGVAKRCGAIRTSQVQQITTLLLLRCRYHILTTQAGISRPLLAEDCMLAAFARAPQNAEWLPAAKAEALLEVTPDANVAPDQAQQFLRAVLDSAESIRPHLQALARQRGEELLQAHARVRAEARISGPPPEVETMPDPDILGLYVFLPTRGQS